MIQFWGINVWSQWEVRVWDIWAGLDYLVRIEVSPQPVTETAWPLNATDQVSTDEPEHLNTGNHVWKILSDAEHILLMPAHFEKVQEQSGVYNISSLGLVP